MKHCPGSNRVNPEDCVDPSTPWANKIYNAAPQHLLANIMSGCAGSEPYALRVLGDSMAPEFTEGEVIVIEPGVSCETGSYVIAYCQDEYVFRMLSINNDQLYLRPLNDDYPAIKIDDKSQIKGRIISKSSGKGRQIKSYL